MALDHAILVSLLERPGSGYELARRFERSIGYFWTATHQQIYRVLGRMVSDGLLLVREVEQQGRPDKKEYSVTESGRTALTAWLHKPIEPESLRHDLAVKIRGAAFDDPAALIREVERHHQCTGTGSRTTSPGNCATSPGPTPPHRRTRARSSSTSCCAAASRSSG